MLGSTFLIHYQQIGRFDSFNQMVHFLGTCRPSPTLSFFAHYRHQISLKSSQLSVPRNGFSPFRRIFQASLQSNSTNGDAGLQLPADQSEIIFMGTGTSEGIPRVSCLTNPLKTCPVCSKAVEPGNKNRRLNTSILIRYPGASGSSNILIDAGNLVLKCMGPFPCCPGYFNTTGLARQYWLPALGKGPAIILDSHSQSNKIGFLGVSPISGFSITVLSDGFLPLGVCLFITSCVSVRIRTIDAVIITHSHADAIGGLDDLRDWTNNVQPSIPIYVAQRDLEVMKKTHYYIVDTSVILPGAAVSDLQFNIIQEEPFVVRNLKITPLPVWHGCGYRSLGFRFGNICYISDVSEIPEETYPLLKDCEILILDALRPDRSSSTHFGLPRALEEVRKIQPKRTLFTGMMHLMDHEKVNDYLMKLKETEGLDMQLSYDGLRVPVTL